MTLRRMSVRSAIALCAFALCAVPLRADCLDDDGFADNDDCFAPLPLPNTLNFWLAVQGAAHAGGLDEDYWVLENVFPGETVTVGLFYPVADGDVDLEVYADLGCANLLDGSYLNTGNEAVTVTNNGASPRDYYLHVLASDPNFECNLYSLSLSYSTPDCSVDDAFEPNDSCVQATPLGMGLTADLRVSETDGDDRDYYSISVPPGDLLTVDMLYARGGDSPDLKLRSGPTCGVVLGGGDGHHGSSQVQWANASAVAETVVLVVEYSFASGDCGLYQLNLSTQPAACLAIDDALEDNDDCASAVPLGIGLTTDLFVSADSDYYSLTVAAGDSVVIDIDQVANYWNETVFLFLYQDGACASQVDTTWVSPTGERVSWINGTGSAAQMVLEVDINDAECNEYDLFVTMAPDLCLAGLPEDAFEDNEDCASAPLMLPGSLADLTLRKSDWDYYAVDVPAGQSLLVDVHFALPTEGLRLWLYDDPAQCGDQVVSAVAFDFATATGRGLVWGNATGVTVRVYLEVLIRNIQAFPECGEYDLDLALGGYPATPFCFGDGSLGACPCGNESNPGAGEGCANGLGHGAILSATGTAVLANDDLVIHMTQARPNQPSLLVRGSTQITLPFKDGLFCTGNPTLRVEVIFLDGNGAGSSLGSLSRPGQLTLFPGMISYFQQWYRDPQLSPCASGSNFSQGLIVPWQ